MPVWPLPVQKINGYCCLAFTGVSCSTYICPALICPVSLPFCDTSAFLDERTATCCVPYYDQVLVLTACVEVTPRVRDIHVGGPVLSCVSAAYDLVKHGTEGEESWKSCNELHSCFWNNGQSQIGDGCTLKPRRTRALRTYTLSGAASSASFNCRDPVMLPTLSPLQTRYVEQQDRSSLRHGVKALSSCRPILEKSQAA